jgi:hypothetical protein
MRFVTASVSVKFFKFSTKSACGGLRVCDSRTVYSRATVPDGPRKLSRNRNPFSVQSADLVPTAFKIKATKSYNKKLKKYKVQKS